MDTGEGGEGAWRKAGAGQNPAGNGGRPSCRREQDVEIGRGGGQLRRSGQAEGKRNGREPPRGHVASAPACPTEKKPAATKTAQGGS